MAKLRRLCWLILACVFLPLAGLGCTADLWTRKMAEPQLREVRATDEKVVVIYRAPRSGLTGMWPSTFPPAAEVRVTIGDRGPESVPETLRYSGPARTLGALLADLDNERREKIAATDLISPGQFDGGKPHAAADASRAPSKGLLFQLYPRDSQDDPRIAIFLYDPTGKWRPKHPDGSDSSATTKMATSWSDQCTIMVLPESLRRPFADQCGRALAAIAGTPFTLAAEVVVVPFVFIAGVAFAMGDH
jgi:hypothetical protein